MMAHLILLAASSLVLRLAPPVMQVQRGGNPEGDPVHPTGQPVGDRYAGAAVPFAPIGQNGGGSTASMASQRGMTGAVPGDAARSQRPAARSQRPPAARSQRPQQASTVAQGGVPFTGNAGSAADRWCGAAVPFSPPGSVGDGSTASAAAMAGNTGAFSPRQPNIPKPRQQQQHGEGSAAVSAARGADAAGSAAAGSLVDKKNAIANELGLSGNLPSIAAAAADVLGIDLGPSGMPAAELIDQCYRQLFG